MPGIEFLPENPGNAEAEEVLDVGSHRKRSTWLVRMAVAALVVGAVTTALQRGDKQPSASPSPTPLPAQSVVLVPNDHVGGPLAAGAGEPVLDVKISTRGTWLLQARTVQALLGRNPPAAVPGPALVNASGTAEARLVLDLAARRLWVVASTDKRGRVLEYEADSMRLLLDVRSAPAVTGAAALGGHLYLTSGRRLLDVAPSGVLGTAARIRSTLGQIIADPERERLLMVDVGRPTRVRAVVPRPGATPRISDPVRIAVTKASLAVANGWIWLAGFDTGDGVLMRLDPRTLRPELHSTLDPILEPGAALVAGGSAAVWARDGGNGRELRCIDARNGQQAQRWNIEGQVTSTNAGALVATTEGVMPLWLDGCKG